jgi:hypothetical protein
MPYAWVYVVNNGSGTPQVVRRSHTTTVVQNQPGEYVVTFPSTVRNLTCVGTLNNSVGTITVVPGDHSGLAANQVRVLTLSLQNQFVGTLDFSLAVFWALRLPPVLDTAIERVKRARRKAKRKVAKSSRRR